MAALYPEGPASKGYTSVVNGRHYDRLQGLLDDAKAKGARVVATGPSPDRAKVRAHTIPPTLVLDFHDDMRIMQEEIFGPVLPIVTYGDLDEAIAYVGARPRALFYYFGSSATNRTRVLSQTISGGVTIIGTLLHYVQEDLPFGGVGPSGLGAYQRRSP